MNKKIEENIFATVIRYDTARSLFDSIVAMEQVAQIYPEYECEVMKIRDNMWGVLVKIAESELGNVDEIKSQLEKMML